MVEYLEIFGKAYPVRLGYFVMRRVKEKTGLQFQEALDKAEEEEDFELHEDILFAALQMGAHAEQEELDLEREQMPVILDLVFVDYFKLFSSDTFFPTELQEEVEKKQNSRGNDKPQRTKKKKQ